jgi:glycerophosphoryl diester phosphodiesterase
MKCIAHRGYSKCFPENTLPAFSAVLEHPACGKSIAGIELDVHATADNHLVVMHDTSILNPSGVHVRVSECSMDDVRGFYHRHYGEDHPGVPELSDVLARVAHRCELNIEIKTGNYDLPSFFGALIKALSAYGAGDDIVISSFSYDLLEYTRRHGSSLKLRYAYLFQSADALTAVPVGVRSRFDLLHPSWRLLLKSPGIFDRHGPPIRAWTVNDRAVVSDLAQLPLPVEAFITDDIALAGKE